MVLFKGFEFVKGFMVVLNESYWRLFFNKFLLEILIVESNCVLEGYYFVRIWVSFKGMCNN